MDIGPGDWVECVDASPTDYDGLPCGLSLGALYRVRAVRRATGGLQVDGFSYDRPGLAPYHRADRFRPIYRPRSELFTHLLEPVDGKVTA